MIHRWSLKAKVLIHHSVYIPLLTYCYDLKEAISDTCTENCFLRRVSVLAIRDRAKELGEVLLHVKTGRPRWLRHLITMPSGCLPVEVWRACPTWRRPWS